MWLASCSRRDAHGQIVPTETWTPDEYRRAEAAIDRVLTGLGDPGQERGFRMCITLCRHRAVTDAEARQLPAAWYEQPANSLAGGPVQLLWERGVPHVVSTEPCTQPRWTRLSLTDPRLKAPLDCGACPSCLARAATVGKPCRRPAAVP